MAYEFSRYPLWLLGGDIAASSAFTAFTIDSAFVYETSGDAWLCRFTSPVSQTSGALTVYAFVNATAGSPTDFRLEVRDGAAAGQDPDRPEAGGSPLATSGATDLSGTAGTWVAFTIASVSLTQGLTYWLVIRNATGTPASNNADLIIEPASSILGTRWLLCQTGSTTDGIATDPSMETSMGAVVIKFDDGTLFGNPFVKSETQTGANDRGNRIVLPENVTVSGAAFATGGSAAGNLSGFEIWQGTDSIVAAANTDETVQNRTTNIRHAPTTLSKSLAYDCVWTSSVSDSFLLVFTMGEAEGSVPADVLACRPPSWAYVTGSTDPTSTPYTADTSKIAAMMLIVDTVPEVATSGGGFMSSGLPLS